MTTWYNSKPPYLEEELQKIAKHLFQPGKGIMGADESFHTMERKLLKTGIENSAETRRKWRQLIFSTEGIQQYVSGIIMTPETIGQETDGGVKFIDYLRSKGIVSGVKLDTGLVPLVNSLDEPISIGLENLSEKCALFKQEGVHFAKWRCVLRISAQTPSPVTIRENATVLARFASICQENRLVPIVEPDIEQDGNHTLDRSQKVTESVLAQLFLTLQEHHVFLSGLILKCNMVTAGMMCYKRYTLDDMAKATLEAMTRTVPAAVMGISFLAGSLEEREASVYLDTIVRYIFRKPWYITFSFSRAINTSALEIWKGNEESIPFAQKQLMIRLRDGSLASLGKLCEKEEIPKAQEDENRIPTHQFYENIPRNL